MAKRKPSWFSNMPKLVEVLWEDHHRNSTDRKRAFLIQSTGYVVFESDDVIQLSGSIGEDKQNWPDETLTILKKCIVRRRRLKA